MEAVTVPLHSKSAHRTLADLAPSRQSGVQVAGINRGGFRILNPGGDEKLLPGDEVLVLGNSEQIGSFRAIVREETGPGGSTSPI